MNLTKTWVVRIMSTQFCCRRFSQEVMKQTTEKANLSFIRNIGILAHIDAGKTTTTERMLYYSGTIRQMGEVHHGNTVTDFMEEERQRGITITSASVTFKWGKHQINLLDTPGHIDFTMEVEQTLNVMDGAVVILDGSAGIVTALMPVSVQQELKLPRLISFPEGVEAQTVTVWKQADRCKIPRIIYINKMDKPGAGFFKSINSIQKNLHVVPVIVHLPIINQSQVSHGKFEGIVDLLTLEKCEWNNSTLGVDYFRKPLTVEDGTLWEAAVKERMKLTETLADLDDSLAEMIITDGKEPEALPTSVLKESVRKITLKQKGVPVLCGSSYRNIGVQLLIDGVVDYLPTPLNDQTFQIVNYFGDNFCARAFKVRHDSFKGPITFLRIYSGNLTKGQKIYNIKREKTEQCGRLYMAYADDYEEVADIGAGNIVVVTGLKYTMTGELVTSSTTVSQSDKAAVGLERVLSLGTFIPDPVFFCSIEASSQKYQAALDKALSELEREDPSLRVTVNNETGQTVLGGMGELHLEVIRERIRSKYKVDADLGPLQIAYKEALIEGAKGNHIFQNTIGNTFHSVSIDMSVLIADDKDSGRLLLDKSPECVDNTSAIFPKHLLAVKRGIESALQNGPKVSSPVVNVNVMLHRLEVGRGTSESIISSVSSQCLRKLLKAGGTKLLEPIMLVEIVCNERTIEVVLNDLGRRRAELESTDTRVSDVVIRSLVPLSELLGYSKELRILTSGTATFSMEFHSLKEMSLGAEVKAISSVTGFHYK